MYDQTFQALVEQHQPTGEVVAVDRFIIKVSGLTPVGINAVVLFANGQRGLVREIYTDEVVVLCIDRQSVPIGTFVVVEDSSFKIGVGEALVGRVISARGTALDGNPTPLLTDEWPVFNKAPALIERAPLEEQLATGVTVVDTLFPIVLGQRIAILGDSKAGKTTFLMQIARSQHGTARIVVLVLVSKRPADIDMVISGLRASGALEHTIVIATSIFDSLVESYLAPYVGCAVAEYLWNAGHDVVVLYDDLTNHAAIHREISLLAGVSPGRDSYPGDMFYSHSSLLERAGRLASNNRSLTAIPAVLTPSGDITGFLPTNIISITDGQIVFDLDIFRQGVKPAVNVGLSVSRVGGRGQSQYHKTLASEVFKKMAQYRQATEFSHFASELALDARKDLAIGGRILKCLKQTPDESYSLVMQQLMLAAVLQIPPEAQVNIDNLKKLASTLGPTVVDEPSFKAALGRLVKENTVQVFK